MTVTDNSQVRQGNPYPTQKVLLSDDKTKTYGPEAVALYGQTGRMAQPWQANLLNYILAENDECLWVHTRFGYSVPRRNGKNEIVAMREMWGLENGEAILHTAHRTTTSHTAWERLCTFLDKAGIKYKSIKASGRENIRLKDTEGRIEFRTRSPKGGLGEGYDLLVIDEAQEYTLDQESALKYVVSDSKNPQTIFCGTPPTPISSGTVFAKMRSSVLKGDTENIGWAEWSVEHQSDPYDRELWYETNPSLGTILTERKIADEISDDDVDFNIQRLGLWLKYNQKSEISRQEWNELLCSKFPEIKGKLYIGIKYSKDGNGVAMSVAAKTKDDRIFVETINQQPVRVGPSWIITFLRSADIGAVAIDGASGQQMLANEMKDAKLKAPVLPTVRQIIEANAAFEQGIFQKTLCHMEQPAVTQIVSNCERRAIGNAGGFGFNAMTEDGKVEILESLSLAYWQCSIAKERKRQRASY